MALYRVAYDDDGTVTFTEYGALRGSSVSAGRTTFEQRLGQLVRLLDSPSDGECLSAARSVRRLLQSNGHDIHWLANLIEHPEVNGSKPAITYTEAEAIEIYQRGKEDGRKEIEAKSGNDFRNIDGTVSWHGMAIFLFFDKIDNLDSRHHEFIRRCASRTAAGWELSEPMKKYLKSLYYENGGRP
jgi:hypothetical protein